MSKGFDPRFMQELKQRNDIVDVIGSYIPLDRKGNTHWACCPFHHERTPSFAVNQSEQFYHCFGCGVSGDVVGFVREIEPTDFMGAIRILAGRAKMQVPETNFDTEHAIEMKKKRDKMASIMLDSAKFYLSNLYSGDSRAEAHLQYISNRKLSPTTVKKFGLGASLDFYSLPEYLAGKGYSKQDLIDSGAVSEGKNGRLVDFEAGRLIFPIINAFDEVVAFGGRLLEKSDFAKYKNTRETLLFNKRKTLYNINLLKKLKRKRPISEVIMVEGYMDTISLYQAGFENVVASMGTSLTVEQARLIKRYSSNVYISYDGDFAGQNADLRGLEILKDEDLHVRVVPMPDGLDPDDVVKQGKEAYQKCLDEAMPLVDYKIHALERKYTLSDTAQKRRFVAEALEVVAKAESESVKEELLKKLRDKTGISYHALERDLLNGNKERISQEPSTQVQAKIAETASGTDKRKKAMRFILASKLFSAPYAKSFDLTSIVFTDETQNIVAKYVLERENANERIRPSELFEILDESSQELNEILDLSYGDKLTGEVAERFFFDSVRSIQSEDVEKEIQKLNGQYSKETDEEKRKEIAKKLAELMKRRIQLKTKK
ncbi:MAG: DNA primase [Clostridiales bacterium]|nr:DNA primase [Clostridiales bacterium]